jgi:uncharacterized protein
VREAAQRLSRYGLARLASGHGSRAVKYRHLAEDALSLGREELAVLAVLLLRGPQTPGELKARTERMANLESLEDVERVLETLIDRDYARRIGRRPGQKEDRFEQLLGGESDEEARPLEPGAVSGSGGEPSADSSSPVAPSIDTLGQPTAQAATVPAIQELVTRLDALEDEVSALREEVSALREEVSGLREEVSALRRGQTDLEVADAD